MNHLIIYAHPNSNSFNKAILDRAVQACDGQVIIRDLYAENLSPTLTWPEAINNFGKNYSDDVQKEHQYWRDADVITLIYPLWWMGFPAILKGYLDRILTYGFAYESSKNGTIGLLKGKKVQQFVTMGNSNVKYEEKGFLTSLDHTLGNGLFSFCGIENVDMHFFGSIGSKSINYEEILQKVEQCCKNQLSQPIKSSL